MQEQEVDWQLRAQRLENQRDQLQAALGNLVRRIYAESMIPASTLVRWRRELEPATQALKASGWYDEDL